ncbi:hypothetical protein KQX54_009089 [Cotesia glomerata]|uniref:Uncharacterized protein n=1 Tax=Cotesia glomerata TaxID=32391 RepID=A0AAV7INU5_COTGL|nr:hypothetical protein KQX54_009089 [Cotesia glomerata]
MKSGEEGYGGWFVFRGMLAGRFPRGPCYRLYRMTSNPRYQILNLLAPGRLYPPNYISKSLPHFCPPGPRWPLDVPSLCALAM